MGTYSWVCLRYIFLCVFAGVKVCINTDLSSSNLCHSSKQEGGPDSQSLTARDHGARERERWDLIRWTSLCPVPCYHTWNTSIILATNLWYHFHKLQITACCDTSQHRLQVLFMFITQIKRRSQFLSNGKERKKNRLVKWQGAVTHNSNEVMGNLVSGPKQCT